MTWSSDLDAEISQADWKKVCQDAQSQTINTKLKLLQFKWIMHTYVTPTLLHCFDNNNSDFCNKCSKKEGTLLHCLWSCPKIKKFWEKIIETDIISVQLS